MPTEPRIFIGSSTEGLKIAECVQEILTRNGYRSLGWWEPSAFPAGEGFMESLQRILAEYNAALFIATPDDLTVIRDQEVWTARGNVLLEYGMFMGLHGRARVALVASTDTVLPNDLNGISTIRLQGEDGLLRCEHPDPLTREDFTRLNRSGIENWASRVRGAPRDAMHEIFDIFPRVADVLVDALRRIRDNADPSTQRDWDLVASDILEAVAATVDASNYGIDDALIDNLSRHVLPKCSAIYAVDVLGPRGWVSPRSYRYLAPQIRRYIQANTNEGGVWQLRVSAPLKKALELASANALAHEALDQSLTQFDNPEYLQWAASDQPKLEFARVLLWSKKELLSPVAEAVIAIHNAFNVPLFFLQRPVEHPDRDVDYIMFGVSDGIDGFYGLRSQEYATRGITRARIPSLGHAWNAYQKLLESPDLLFAHDAHYLALSGEL